MTRPKGWIARTFHKASEGDEPKPHKKQPAPFSLRLNGEERATLEREAGDRPLGAHIRDRLLGEQATKRRAARRPKPDAQEVARLLAVIGQTRIASNLNQLAKSANMGTLPVSKEVEQELHDACAAVIGMRNALLEALGLKAESDS